jgi:type VI secretion system protein ImpK
MREDLANRVYPVILRALDVRDRLARGEAPDFESEHAAFRGLLLGEDRKGAADQGPGNTRYMLACWLDEFFIEFTPWAELWQEKKLETALFGTNERAWRPWEEARQAERRGDGDALEAFFLTVLLGFRGDLRQDPERLRSWVAAARTGCGRLRPWKSPPERDATAAVPPLRGRTRLRRAVLACGLLFVLLVPVAAFFVAAQLAK